MQVANDVASANKLPTRRFLVLPPRVANLAEFLRVCWGSVLKRVERCTGQPVAAHFCRDPSVSVVIRKLFRPFSSVCGRDLSASVRFRQSYHVAADVALSVSSFTWKRLSPAWSNAFDES